MRTSIRNRLFLIIYGIILAFIVGLILLNTVFLEGFYTKSRERTLVAAFEELEAVSLTSPGLFQTVLDIENQYAVNVQILKQTDADPGEPGGPGIPLSEMYDRLYGDAFAIRDGVIAAIMRQFNDGDESGFSSVEVSDDVSYVAYMTEIVMAFGSDAPENPRLLALCVGQVQNDGLYVYYILTVTIQSIQDSIGIFNAFTVIIAALFMILSGVAVGFFSRRFTQPILQMNAVTQNLAAQDFTKKVAPSTKDELGDLGLSINKMSEQLETSIRDLKRANQQLAEDIELKNRIDTMRKEFIANASHELKTPISLILGYSEALKLPGLDQLTVAEYLDIIIDESNKMNKLVMSLLKISQLEGGFQQFCVESFPIKGLVDETMKLFSIKFAEKAVNVCVDADDIDVVSDYDAIQTVLNNYLSNAINHVEGEMRIGVTVKPDETGRIRVEVFNTGKPIPEESLTRIWESFYKVDKARTRAYGGQGLGLSIVRILLESLHAGYGVANKEDGVLFWFDLPPAQS